MLCSHGVSTVASKIMWIVHLLMSWVAWIPDIWVVPCLLFSGLIPSSHGIFLVASKIMWIVHLLVSWDALISEIWIVICLFFSGLGLA